VSCALASSNARNIPWLVGLPRDWSMVPSRSLFRVRHEPARSDDPPLTASQEDGVILQEDFIARAGRKVTEVRLNTELRKHVERGDFIISMRSFQGGIERAHAAGCISSAYVVLMPSGDVDGDYYKYVFKSAVYVHALQATSNLVRDGQALRYENFCRLDLPVPPGRTQRTIARFLDEKTAAVDARADKCLRLIALERERRAALIQRAVTRGLDPSARRVKSAVPWIGAHPAHWVQKRIKLEYRFSKGRTAQQLSAAYIAEHPGPYPVYSGQTEDEGVMGCIDRYAYDLPEALVVTTVGSTKVMTPRLIRGRFSLSQNCALITPLADACARFLCYQLPALFAYERASIPEHLQASLRIEDLRRFDALFPPPEEQRRIADHLDRLTAAIDQRLHKLALSVARLREDRSALVSAAVTGKLNRKLSQWAR
jgi:type I restriction enzyme S subunit